MPVEILNCQAMIKVAGIAQSVLWLDYRLDSRGLIPGRDREIFSSSPHPDRLWGPPITNPKNTGNSYPGFGREGDHSPPSSAEAKNALSYTSTPPHIFMAWWLVKYRTLFMVWYLVKHRDSFSFTFTLGNETVLGGCIHLQVVCCSYELRTWMRIKSPFKGTAYTST
jgi:hypothetical protein